MDNHTYTLAQAIFGVCITVHFGCIRERAKEITTFSKINSSLTVNFFLLSWISSALL